MPRRTGLLYLLRPALARQPSLGTLSGATVPTTPVTAVLLRTFTDAVPIRVLEASASSTPASEQCAISAGSVPPHYERVPLNRRPELLHPVFHIELARDHAASAPSSLLLLMTTILLQLRRPLYSADRNAAGTPNCRLQLQRRATDSPSQSTSAIC